MKDWMEYLKARKDREQNDKEQAAKKDAPKTNTAWVRGNVKPVVKTQAPTPAPRPENFKWEKLQTTETAQKREEREKREKAEALLEQYNAEIKNQRKEQGSPPPIPVRPHAKTANPGSDSETSPRGDFPDPPKKPLPTLKKKVESKDKKNLKQFLAGDHRAPPKPPGMK